MSDAGAYFSPDFATAQSRFRAAVADRHGRLDVLEPGVAGPTGEPLTIDIGWFGAPRPARALVHSSGLHGVEGYAGSAIQLQWLARGIGALPGDAAIAIVHVLNPYGFAWTRRVNENNVDLNRNFRPPGDDGADLGGDYAAFDALLNPRSVPRADFFYARAAWRVLRNGMANLRQAIGGGQCVNPRGIFYSGTRMEAGPELYQGYIKDKLARASRIVAIDVHTGLGRYGKDTLLVDASKARAGVNLKMRESFGERIQLSDSESIAYRVRGAQEQMYFRFFSVSAVHFATQEFGTFHALRVLAALRAENRWHHHGAATPDHPSKKQLLKMFCPDDEAWRENVLRRGQEVVREAHALAFGTSTANPSLVDDNKN